MDQVKNPRPTRQAPAEHKSPLGAIGVPSDLQQTPVIQLKKRPKLGRAAAAAYKGNLLTGATFDARRPDLPPFAYNPPPNEILLRRKEKLAGTYARPAVPPPHPSSKNPLALYFNPATRRIAVLQHLIQTNPTFRAALEKTIVARVVRDGRADGIINVVDGNSQIAVSQGAMSQLGAGNVPVPPAQSLYEMLAQLDHEVMMQVAQTAATANSGSTGGDGATFPPGSPFGSGLESQLSGGPDGLAQGQDDEEGSEASGSSFDASGMTFAQPTALPSMPGSDNAGNKSTDVEGQKVAQLVQRLNQMYTLISAVFAKYHSSGVSAINNMR